MQQDVCPARCIPFKKSSRTFVLPNAYHSKKSQDWSSCGNPQIVTMRAQPPITRSPSNSGRQSLLVASKPVLLRLEGVHDRSGDTVAFWFNWFLGFCVAHLLLH